MTPRLAAATLAVALVGAGGPAWASPDAADTRLGLRAHAGGSITGRPDDAPGEVTLLLGTGFTGPAFGFEGTARHAFRPWLALRAGLGLFWARGTGWAEADGLRRELTLSFTALEIPILVEFTWEAHPVVSPWLAVGLAPRFGLTSSATEVRTGFREDAGAPSIDRNRSIPLLLEGGVAFTSGPHRIPIGLRVAWNATYPSRTRDRLPSYRSPEQPGPYLVDNDLSIVATFGVDLGF